MDFDLTLKPVNDFTLDNGVPCYSLNAGEQEVLMVEWVFMRATGTKKKIGQPLPTFSAEKRYNKQGPPLK